MLGPVIAVAGIGALALLASSSKKSTGPAGKAADGTGGGAPPVPADGSKVPPGIKLISCDQAYAMLPSALQILVTNAQKGGPAEMNNAADAMDSAAKATGLSPDAANTLHVAAGCLRSLATAALGKSGAPTGGGKPIGQVDDFGVPYNPTGGADRKDCATNPAAQYYYTVKAGENASILTARILGAVNATPFNWSKLVSLNATTDTHGNPTGTVGTPGTLSYNFKRLDAGYQLLVPKEWNQYIGQVGVLRASMTPLPACG